MKSVNPNKRTAFILIYGMFYILIGTGYAQELWGDFTENHPRRQGHSMVKLSDDRVLIFGGEDANADLFNDLHVFKEGDNWSLVTPKNESPEARKDHDAWQNDDKMYISGGINSAKELMNDLWRYDPDQNQWEEIILPDPKPGTRMNHASAVSEEGIVVMAGGQGFGEGTGLLNHASSLADCWTYNIAENTYEKQDNVPHVAYDYEMVRYKGKYYILQVFAGGSKMFRLENVDTNPSWVEIEQTGDVPDFALAACAVKLPYTGMFKSSAASEVAIRMGGLAYRGIDGFQPASDVWLFNFETETWIQKENMPYALMNATAVYDSEHNRIKVYGGLKADSTINDKVLVYQLSETLVKEPLKQPKGFHLSQNYPNPFNPSTTIQYSIMKSEMVTLSIYDARGRVVENLVNTIQPPGVYQVRFEANHVPSGVYGCRLQTGPATQSIKMLLMK